MYIGPFFPEFSTLQKQCRSTPLRSYCFGFGPSVLFAYALRPVGLQRALQWKISTSTFRMEGGAAGTVAELLYWGGGAFSIVHWHGHGATAPTRTWAGR